MATIFKVMFNLALIYSAFAAIKLKTAPWPDIKSALSLPDGSAASAADASARPPLLVLLHGSGADEHDLLPLAPALSAAVGGALVASLRGPFDQLGGFAWFHGNSRAPPPHALSSQIPQSVR